LTIHPQHVADLQRLAPYYKAPMLMLGATDSVVPEFPTAADFFGQWVGDEYEDLDLDESDIELDLNGDLKQLSQKYGCVFNVGTLEHVWNTHAAWVNALRAVKRGGYFLCHSPVSGYKNHGLHITSAPAIQAFVSKNGFKILDSWTTQANMGELFWLVAKKEKHIETTDRYKPAMQVYEQGKKKQVT
jgi:hypothetical protein